MSLCVSIYPKTNELIVAADTRKSVKIEGKSYALDDKCQKLYICHGKLIFACGLANICYSVIQEFGDQNDGSINQLRSIAKSHVDSYLKKQNITSAKDMFLCNFLIFYFDKSKGVPVVYNLHSEDGFEIRSYDYYLYWCHGTRCDEAGQFIKDNIYSMSLKKLIYCTYEKVAFEEIGGNIQMYRINIDGISLIDEMKIHDKKRIARLVSFANWNQISNPPSIPSIPSYIKSTHIDSTTVQSPTIVGGTINGTVFNGGMFNINPTGDQSLSSGLTIGGWYEGTGWIGQAMKLKYEPEGHNGYPGTVFSSDSGVPIIFDTMTEFKDYVYFNGTVDFNRANVTGLNVIAKFG